MMHTALIKLTHLQIRGWLRRQFTAGSVHRTIFKILAAVAFVSWISSGLAVGAMFQKKSMDADDILTILPPILTAFGLLPILLGTDDRAIAFTPAEIDFLFPGPFSRRDLVFFKMLRMVLGAILGGLFFAFVARRTASSLLTSAAGSVLFLIFVNLLTTIVALIRDTIQERWYNFARRAALALILLAVIGGVWYLQTATLPSWEEIKRFATSAPARAAFAPARIFAHVYAAQSIAEFAMWAAACLGLIAAAALAVLALDKGYMAAAFAASERRQIKLARMGKGLAINTDRPARTLAIPALGSLGPIGAIIKRQLITAVRTSRAWMLVFLVALGYGYVLSRLTHIEIGPQAGAGTGGVGEMGSAVGMAGMMPGLIVLAMALPQMLRFDFRGDLDYIEGLKALPISPLATAAAEVAVPTAILAAQGVVVLAGVAIFVGLPIPMLCMAILTAIPLAALLIALENFVFLLLPTRLFSPGQSGTALSGRRFLYALARMGLLLVGGGAVAGIGFAAWLVSESPWMTFAACWTTAAVIAALAISAVAWAFARFDVSVDMPT